MPQKKTLQKKKTGHLDKSSQAKNEVQAQKIELTSVQKSLLVVFGFIVIIIFIFVILFYMSTQVDDTQPTAASFEYWYEQTLRGSESDTNYMYGDFVFVFDSQSGYWQTLVEKDGQPFYVRSYYSPRQLENISLNSEIYFEISQKPKSIITLDSSVYVEDYFGHASIGAIEISKIVGQRNDLLNKEVSSAVSNPVEGMEGILVADCQNVTESTSVIKYKMAKNSSIIIEESGCIIIQANSGTEFIRLSNRIMFELLEIMP